MRPDGILFEEKSLFTEQHIGLRQEEPEDNGADVS